MALTDQQLIDAMRVAKRIDDARKPIREAGARNVSALGSTVDQALDMAIHQFWAKRNSEPFATDGAIKEMTDDFTPILSDTNAIMQKMAVIHSLGAFLRDANGDLVLDVDGNPQPDDAQRSANLDAAIAAYPSLDPTTYPARVLK